MSISGAYLINTMSLVLALCAFGCALVSIYLFHFKRSPGTRYLALMVGANAVWCVFYCLEYSAIDLNLRLFWSKLSYFGIIFTPLYFYFFTLRFFRAKPISSMLRVYLFTVAFLRIIGVLKNE